MAYTEDQIKQLGANELGFRQGLDFTSTTSEPIRKINASYDLIKNNSLQNYNWGFATKTEVLESPVELTDNKYQYRYTLPTDFLRFLNAYSNKDRTQVINEYDPPLSGYLDCNTPDKVYLTYIADVDVGVYPDYYVEYLKVKIAFDNCFDLTGDMQLLQVLAAREKDQWKMSTNTDTMQKRTRQIRNKPYITVRG